MLHEIHQDDDGNHNGIMYSYRLRREWLNSLVVMVDPYGPLQSLFQLRILKSEILSKSLLGW